MNVVKEYSEGKTKIRIHDDYVSENSKNTKEMIIGLVINYLKNSDIKV